MDSVGDLTRRLRAWISQTSKDCSNINIMLIGDTGAGKSTLINNLLWEPVAKEGDSVESETSTITKYEGEVKGVPVVFYDTPGLGDSRSDLDDHYLQEIKKLVNEEDIALVIYCFKMMETKMHKGILRTFKSYDTIGIDWSRCVIALTFADSVPVPRSVKSDPNFNMADFFNKRLKEWRDRIPAELEKSGLNPRDLEKIKIHPTTGYLDEVLPNGEEWFFPFWIDVLQALPTPHMIKFLEIHKDNIKYEEESMQRLPEVVEALQSSASDAEEDSISQTSSTGTKTDQDLPEQVTETASVSVSTCVSPNISVIGSSTTVKQENIVTDALSSRALVLNKEQVEKFEEVVSNKIKETVEGAVVGGIATTLGTTALVAAGAVSAPVVIPAAMVGAAAGVITKWLGFW